MKTEGPDIDEQRRVKMVIVKKSNGQPVVDVSREVNGTFEPNMRTGRQVAGFWPDQFHMKLAAEGRERVKIGRRTFDCTTRKYRVKEPKQGIFRELKLWHAPDVTLPYREIIVDQGANVALDSDIVRAKYTVKLGNRTTSYDLRIMSLSRRMRVADKMLECVVERCRAEVKDPDQPSTVNSERWLSQLVPGHVVKMEGTAKIDGAEIRKIETVESFDTRP